jgi:hypothetical protein
MPTFESTVNAEGSWASMHIKSIVSLAATILLCLPSLLGGAAFLANLLLYRDIAEWEQPSSALVALGVLLGCPLVALAAVLGGILAFSRSVPVKMKYAHLFVISLAAIATLSLLLRFGSLSPFR